MLVTIIHTSQIEIERLHNNQLPFDGIAISTVIRAKEPANPLCLPPSFTLRQYQIALEVLSRHRPMDDPSRES